jgi:hypothetical protein
MLGFRKLRYVVAGVLQRDELPTAGQGYRIVKRSFPTRNFSPGFVTSLSHMLIRFRRDRTRVIVHGHALGDKRNSGVRLQHHEIGFLFAHRSDPKIVKRYLLRGSHRLKRENDLCICHIVRAIVRCRNGKPAGAVRIIVRTGVAPLVNGRSRWKWIRLRYWTRDMNLGDKWSVDYKPTK